MTEGRMTEGRMTEEGGVSESSFESVVKLLDYPVFVVTTAAGGSQGGCLVGFATQVSIKPALYLVVLSKRNRTSRLASTATHLVVHVLSADQGDLAELFGGHTGDQTDKLAQWSARPGPGGAPILDGVAGWFGGRILDRVPMGDHVGFLLEAGPGQVLRPGSSQLMLSDVGDLEAAYEA